MQQQVIPGIDHILQQASSYKGKRLALVTNNVAVTSQGVRSREALLKTGFTLVKLFSPEHGLTASGADGAFQENSIDVLTGLPVTSLYGDYLAPAADDLENIDIVLFDIPDVGCRFYTYLWTMTHVMEACAACNKPFIILDRPNPIGGNISLAEGPMLNETHCSSFIGRWSIPIRHSCTFGELAAYFAATKMKTLQLHVIRITSWQRDQTVPASAWKFIPTSPAIQNSITALLYPGMGLLEGINVNEGRGTDKPFQVCGAPWIGGSELQEAFIAKQCDAISCNQYTYTPVEGLYAGQQCNGLEFFITGFENFRPVATGIELLQTIMEVYPDYVEERLYCTRANPTGQAHLDKLLGIHHAFMKIKTREAIKTDITDEWRSVIEPFLLY